MSMQFHLAGMGESINLKASTFDLFVKTINLMPLTAIDIKDSKLTMFVDSSSLVHADFSSILGDNVNLRFALNRELKRKLRKTKGNKEVMIFDKDESQYQIVGNICLSLPKLKDETTGEMPILTDPVASLSVGNPGMLEAAIGKTRTADLLLYDNEIVCIAGNQSRYDVEPKALTEYEGREPDLILRSHSLLKISRKNMVLSVRMEGQSYWLCSEIPISHSLKVFYYEKLMVIAH